MVRAPRRSMGSGNGYKVFLGGLPSNLTETDLRNFFSQYGKVTEVVIMYDQEKKKSRGETLFSSFSLAGRSYSVIRRNN